MPTITGTGQMGPVAVYLTRQFGTSNAADINDPIATIMPDGGGKTQLVAAFMATYYRTGTLTPASLPTPTITGTDRLALVTLTIDGTEYVVVDIGMRMLQPHELALAQGFPPGYNFSPIINGKKMPKSRIVKAIGNSVVPQLAEALVSANYYRRVPEQFAAVGK
jgi:DNA (cytosine-5)-methyltransferase 1